MTRQYDQLVGSGTVIRPGGDAGVVRLVPSDRAVAVALDGNGRRTWLDPRRGAAEAVCEAARNVACTGARPAAVTNCLNFGNPETPDVAYELGEAIEGMAQACEALGLPVVSGNVSLYNEHMGNPIYPTPVVGVVGLLDDASLAVGAGFASDGDEVWLLGAGATAIDGSEYQKVVLGSVEGRIPEPDLANERELHRVLAEAAAARLLRSAHDVSDGGLAVCLAESAIMGGIGVSAEAEPGELFAEGQGRVVVSLSPGHAEALQRLAATLPVRRIGRVGGDAITIGSAQLSVAEATSIHSSAIPTAMGDPE